MATKKLADHIVANNVHGAADRIKAYVKDDRVVKCYRKDRDGNYYYHTSKKPANKSRR